WSYNTAQAYETGEDISEELATGEGKQTFEQVCTSCHPAEIVTRLRYRKEEWASVVEDMVTYGAQASPAQREAVINYLSLHYGATEEDSPLSMARRGRGGLGSRRSEVTPLVVNGVMYLTTPFNRAVALEPETGREIWKYRIDERLGRPAIRGLAYWPGDDPAPPAIIFGTSNGFLVALSAETGEPVASFAENGVLDLKRGMTENFPNAVYAVTSAPAVYKHLIITGSRVQESPALGPAGDVRAWDARTGKMVWRFHTTLPPDEILAESWADDSWKNRSGANVWGTITVDVESGIAYLPVGSVTYDYWGGDRQGNNLYGSTLVALDAETGEVKWHFQTTHHDLWDYDLSAAPVLIDVQRENKKIPAVAQTTKQGLLFFLDRVTGEPIYGVEERPVRQEGFLASEHPWPTQPFPVKPEPLARISFSPAELAKISPEHEEHCRQILEEFSNSNEGGLYSSFGESPSLIFPGTNGGSNWHGASFDPELGYLFVNTQNLGEFFQIVVDGKGEPTGQQIPDLHSYLKGIGYARLGRFWDKEKLWPCQEPPWGELIAVDVNSGDIVWRVPLGSFDELEEKGVPKTGALNIGGSMATAGGLVFVGGTVDGRFRAFDSRTGRELWVTKLGAAARAVPITYLGKDGRQYVAVMVSGGGVLHDPVIPATLMVFALLSSDPS
ncbi:MAG TPA: PQQ-binding-like beta-propeller repeat protein, partial [Acidobacteriota bacterium]|nr:PQQ-binding-like beta-propeller repeat protein [Acidobacteriota bacterium]